MANRFLGEAVAELDGTRYTLRCDFNAMCHFEDETGKDALASFEAFETGGISARDMRSMMWAFLQHHHPEADMRLAGGILSADIEALQRVVMAASPEAQEAGEAGNGKAPRKAKRG
tara:strand:+ start:1882 stop:2229 length:348 start_codon:yes stop_codon:yes gene_type:complete